MSADESKIWPSEYRSVMISVFRDPGGRPTCKSGFTCVFHEKTHNGNDRCQWTCAGLERRENGYLRPCKNCGVWDQEALKE